MLYIHTRLRTLQNSYTLKKKLLDLSPINLPPEILFKAKKIQKRPYTQRYLLLWYGFELGKNWKAI